MMIMRLVEEGGDDVEEDEDVEVGEVQADELSHPYQTPIR